MASWVIDLVESTGYLGIALLMLLETIFPPIPSELIMPLGGYLAAQGKLSVWGVMISGTMGALTGAVFLYALGRNVPLSKLQRWVDRQGRWLTISYNDMGRAEKWFKRYGGWAVFFGRLVPGLRSLISIPAGLGKMKVVPFLMWTTIGSAIWTALLTIAGYVLGSKFHAMGKVLDPVGWVVFGLLVVWYIVRILRHPGKAKRRAHK